jgi:hypothetical protein
MKNTQPPTVLLVVLLIVSLCPLASANKGTALLLNGKIPKGYSTYSLFLICSPEWLGSDRKGDLRDLYGSFYIFGRSIGDNNLAVWFWKGHPKALTGQSRTKSSHRTSEVALDFQNQDVDVERSIRFCKSWNLLPSAGPYLVVTSKYPAEPPSSAGLSKETAVFKLGGMDKKQISSLLGGLIDQLLMDGATHAEATVTQQQVIKKATKPVWIRLLAATQTVLGEFGCAWSFKVDAGPVKSELKSCPAKAM